MTKDKLVTLSLGNGDLYRGVETVTVRLLQANDSSPMQFIGALPPQPELAELYRQWKFLYSALLHRLNQATRIEIASEGTTNVSESEFDELCEQLTRAINHWLNAASFRDMMEKVRTELSPTDEIRFLIETSDPLLQRLPWHLWTFFEAYPKAEVGISAPDYRQPTLLPRSAPSKVRILAILGSNDGIDIDKDWDALNQLSRQGKAEIKILQQPKLNQLNEQLWGDGWDILFFAGHSFSGEKGFLRINQNDRLSLDKLKNGLSRAIERGLKLAIFNSCDGIGLAQALFDLHIPQVIVMREEVPDAVAHQFLPYFLVFLFSGKSLFASVREARERLEGIQKLHPCATWLPVIYQNPAAMPLLLPSPLIKIRFPTVALVSAMIAILCIGIRQMGVFEPVDLWAFDQLIRLRPEEGPDNRLLVIEITEADLKYQRQKNMQGQGSLSDQALQQLLKKLEPLEPSAIGIDVYRDFRVGAKYSALAQQLQHNDQIFSVCKTSEPSSKDSGVKAPPEAPKDQIGFSDIATGQDHIVRSHLLYLQPEVDSSCQANQSLSLQLGLKYLDSQNISVDPSSKDFLKLNKTTFTPLSPSAKGGYHSLDTRGYQILLNYRTPQDEISKTITLTEALENSLKPEWVKNKIVLIGVTAPSQKDDHLTPFASEQPLRGIMLQAQMVSQIISAVLDHRPLLWVWPDWGENLWIFAWSAAGGLLAWRVRSPLVLGIGCAIALVSLGGCCWILLSYGGWIPLIPAAVVLVITPMTARLLNRSSVLAR
jgi:CHASE2 domain-containing sensor protein